MNTQSETNVPSSTDKIYDKNIAFILCFFGGWLGLHYFYVKRIGMGILYLFTFGFFCIGWWVDILRIIFGKFFKESSATFKESPEKRTISYHRKFNVAGVTFSCKLDDSTSRQEMLEHCSKRDTFYLQEYVYDSKPAFLIVCHKNGLDIGCIPADMADKVSKYKERNYELKCLDINCFENEYGKTIFYAKMQFIVYKD